MDKPSNWGRNSARVKFRAKKGNTELVRWCLVLSEYSSEALTDFGLQVTRRRKFTARYKPGGTLDQINETWEIIYNGFTYRIIGLFIHDDRKLIDFRAERRL